LGPVHLVRDTQTLEVVDHPVFVGVQGRQNLALLFQLVHATVEQLLALGFHPVSYPPDTSQTRHSSGQLGLEFDQGVFRLDGLLVQFFLLLDQTTHWKKIRGERHQQEGNHKKGSLTGIANEDPITRTAPPHTFTTIFPTGNEFAGFLMSETIGTRHLGTITVQRDKSGSVLAFNSFTAADFFGAVWHFGQPRREEEVGRRT
jgi:hypothetical protein